MASTRKVYVIGVGMTRFCKPQKQMTTDDPDYPEFGQLAVKRALEDACLTYEDIEAAAVGSAMGANGQRVLYDVGLTGIPIFNVSNACATGSNALYLARSFVAGGMHECAMALGIEKMKPGPLTPPPKAGGGKKRPANSKKPANAMDKHMAAMKSKFELAMAPITPQMFGNAGREHMHKYGSTAEHMAMIGEKNHRHSVNNPYSQFQDEYSLDQIKSAPMIYEPLTKLQCSPTSDGSACAILCSEDFVIKHGLQGQAVEIVGQSMKTDYDTAFDHDNETTCIEMVGFKMAQEAAADVFQQTGKSAKDVQVVELHDCFSCNELLTYEALGMANIGEGHKLLDAGDTTYGGKWVVNPSGGLISKGHPIGATGVAQCCELNWQLRGEAGARQVNEAKTALQHNLGLGGAVVVTMYQKPEQWAGVAPKRKASLAMGPPPSSKL